MYFEVEVLHRHGYLTICFVELMCTSLFSLLILSHAVLCPKAEDHPADRGKQTRLVLSAVSNDVDVKTSAMACVVALVVERNYVCVVELSLKG